MGRAEGAGTLGRNRLGVGPRGKGRGQDCLVLTRLEVKRKAFC